MMASTAVVGLSTGKRLLSTSFYPSDLAEKLFPLSDYGWMQLSSASTKSNIVAKRSSHFGTSIPSNIQPRAIQAIKEHVDTSAPPIIDTWSQSPDPLDDGNSDLESSLEVFVLLQKSMLEKQWELSFNQMRTIVAPSEGCKKAMVTRSGISVRQRRASAKRKFSNQIAYTMPSDEGKHICSSISPALLQTRPNGYMRGTISDNLLAYAEVVHLSKKIWSGRSIDELRSMLKRRLGFEPTDKQLASSLRISHTELRSKLIECSLAREKLAMSNVRLVISIAQKYDNLGAEMADLVQGGLIGLLRGIEKYDSSKGFKISTYVYWWIRQGVSRALAHNSRTLRLPTHLHERLCSIRNAKARLEERGIPPSIEKLAEFLNMSEQKVRNATEAVSKVFSLDRDAFPSLNGLPGETFHSYIADTNLDNNPWHQFEEWSLKDEVNKLLCSTLGERERAIIQLYYGLLGNECHTWEDISKQFGVSRERVRQVGLVAMEKLKMATRRKRLDAMLW